MATIRIAWSRLVARSRIFGWSRIISWFYHLLVIALILIASVILIQLIRTEFAAGRWTFAGLALFALLLVFALGLMVLWDEWKKKRRSTIWGACFWFGVLQAIAINMCLDVQEVWPGIIVWPLATIIAFLPVVGTAGAAYGATDAWLWSDIQATVVFAVLFLLWWFLLSPKRRVRIVGVFGHLLLGLLQAAAIGIYLDDTYSATYGFTWWVTAPVAMFLGYTPIVGTIGAIYSVQQALGWSWLEAVLLFVLPIVLFLILVTVASWLRKRAIEYYGPRSRINVPSEDRDGILG
jgi:hypothetical protein